MSNQAIIAEGDCRDLLALCEEDSVDSVVTDPPYGLSFMGKGWDHGVPGVEFWEAVKRVAKPGAYLLAFGGTRTFHRLTCAIEDTGWEIRDCIMWVYGSGFPKSLNVQQAINKAARGCPQGGVDPQSPNHGKFKGGRGMGAGPGTFMQQEGAGRSSDEGPWKGWGTALKPAWEPIIVARKPLVGTVQKNVEKFGTGAMNIDDCRVETDEIASRNHNGAIYEGVAEGYKRPNKSSYTHKTDWKMQPGGRWPANFIHDGSEEVVELFPSEAGAAGKASGPTRGKLGTQGRYGVATGENMGESKFYGDAGSAARFFYCAKTSKKDRDEGCEGLETKIADPYAEHRGRRMPEGSERFDGKPASEGKNHHPTVKPTDLMRYLCRLVTPPGGIVLDPFCGSGSTGKAALAEGFDFVGMEKEPEYARIARSRCGVV